MYGGAGTQQPHGRNVTTEPIPETFSLSNSLVVLWTLISTIFFYMYFCQLSFCYFCPNKKTVFSIARSIRFSFAYLETLPVMLQFMLYMMWKICIFKLKWKFYGVFANTICDVKEILYLHTHFVCFENVWDANMDRIQNFSTKSSF